MRIVLLSFSLMSCLVLSAGCFSSNQISGFVPAEGKVLLDGTPVAEANIVFMPVAGSASDRYATAVSKPDGTFQLKTYNSSGILPGKYAITISKKIVKSKVSSEEETRLTEAGQQIPDPEITFLVPEKYEKTETSGFALEIGMSGKKDILFELTN